MVKFEGHHSSFITFLSSDSSFTHFFDLQHSSLKNHLRLGYAPERFAAAVRDRQPGHPTHARPERENAVLSLEM